MNTITLKPPRRLWTHDEIFNIKEWRLDGVPWVRIDRRLNRKEGASSDKMTRINTGLDRDPTVEAKVETVTRKCMNCDNTFEAPGRFIRVCPPCKKTDAFLGTSNDFHIAANL